MQFPMILQTTVFLMASIVAADLNLGPRHLQKNSTSSSSSLTGDDPIPLFDLPVIVPGPSFRNNPYTVEAIRNTLAHYILAVDGKNFDALSLSLAPDIIANYSAPLGLLNNLTTVQTALAASLKPVTTQHLMGTQIIDILSPKKAFSISYVQSTHFGVGAYFGETVRAYIQYQDVWKKQKDLTWRVSHRNLVYMGPIVGNLSIFTPQ